MAIKRRNKVDPSSNMSSMSDMVFQILIFFMLTTTLVTPNALKLQLPQSNSQVTTKPILAVSIDASKTIFFGSDPVSLNELERRLQQHQVKPEEDPTIALYVDRTVPIEEVVNVMNIARDNQYKLILATQPLKK